MKLHYDAKTYNKLDRPWDSVVRFIKVTLPGMGWSKGEEAEVVMDVGCGPGKLTSQFILPCFPKLKKIIALDAIPGMIEEAESSHPHPKIEYAVANFEERSSVIQWKGQITKFICIQCFNRIKNQENAFKTIYDLLPPKGEAALLFLLHNGYYNAILKIAEDPNWKSFFTVNVTDCIPESHLKKYSALHYKDMVKDVGFTIRYCREKQNVTTFANDEEYIEFYYSVCSLVPYIPPSKVDEFKRDLLFYIIEENGRNSDGTPVDKTTTLELVLEK
ncbi:methyltransf_25 domain-containing protein [Trichonephila clavata]|uniref:Methyltransf_25 domain-containing protein n=1 Tax=Trichonephila clavata TaxID=2740835 RepID=A0A8X6L1P9_TRICU|nr:methyltransf_25 domain-containing protein [Trichonephila clavata]